MCVSEEGGRESERAGARRKGKRTIVYLWRSEDNLLGSFSPTTQVLRTELGPPGLKARSFTYCLPPSNWFSLLIAYVKTLVTSRLYVYVQFHLLLDVLVYKGSPRKSPKWNVSDTDTHTHTHIFLQKGMCFMWEYFWVRALMYCPGWPGATVSGLVPDWV